MEKHWCLRNGFSSENKKRQKKKKRILKCFGRTKTTSSLSNRPLKLAGPAKMSLFFKKSLTLPQEYNFCYSCGKYKKT